MNTHVYTAGKQMDPHKPSIVLLHGAGSDHSAWTQQARCLVRKGFNALAFDLPGHGRTDGPGMRSVAAYAQWVLERTAGMGLTQVAVAGHSMGSLIALHMHSLAPERVQAVAMVASTVPMAVNELLLDSSLNDAKTAHHSVATWSFLASHRLGTSPQPGTLLMETARKTMDRTASGVLHGDFTACNGYDTGWTDAERAVCPVWLISGQKDQMTPLSTTTGLLNALRQRTGMGEAPYTRHIILPECGHSPMVEQTAHLNGCLTQWAQLTAKTSS